MGLHQGALRLAAVAVLTLLPACGDDAPDRPEWRGKRELSTERRTARDYTTRQIELKDAEALAARVLGVPRAQAEVTVSAVAIKGERPAAPGATPDFAAARATVERALRLLKMEPTEWALLAGPVIDGAQSVFVAVTDKTATYALHGVREPSGTFSVDAKGVRKFDVTPVRLSSVEVPILSEAEAFERLEKPGSYVGLALVVIAVDQGRARPGYSFRGEDRRQVPVVAVLTP